MTIKRYIIMLLSIVFVSTCLGCGSNEASALPDNQNSAVNEEFDAQVSPENNDTEQIVAPASPEYIDNPEEDNNTDLSEKGTEEAPEANNATKENKRPVSVVAKDQTADSKIDFFDDGSYSIRVPVRQYDYLIYFSQWSDTKD